MRTFHTGGIFTSSTTKQLISPIDGTIEFSKFLKTITIRTNRGENVLLTENSGFLTILAKDKNNFQIELPRAAEKVAQWKLRLEFEPWLARIGTPGTLAEGIRSLLDAAPREVREALELSDATGYDFTMPVALIEGMRR